MKVSTFVLCLFFLVVGIFVTALNSESVRFDYYLSSIDLPLSILLIMILLIGIVVGVFMSLGSVMKLRWENRSLKKKLKNLEGSTNSMDITELNN
jgi:putative membrane protein